MERLILIILILMPGVWSGSWRVTPKDQCAVKGTSAVINCQYDYPFGHIVTSVNWVKTLYVSGEWRTFVLSQLPSPPGHFQYVGNYWTDCSLKVNDVQHADEGEYFFHFKTTLNRWRSKVAARLSVRDLTAVVQSSSVTEGDEVRLNCVSGCPSPVNTVWFRDGQLVPDPVFQAGTEDAGRYYCAILGQEATRSASVALEVKYAPRKVMLSMSPSVVKGGSVTFTCTSDANPPVPQHGYSLYRDGRFITSGQNHTISDVQPGLSGLYYCQAWNNISRGGVNLFNSTEVHLDVQYRPENISISMTPPHVVEGSRVNLTCSSDANPAADSYTWFRVTASSLSSVVQVGSGQVLSVPSVEVSHAGLYFCQARNHLGENNSTTVLLVLKERTHGGKSLKISAGIGVSVFVTALLLLLVLFWLKQRTHAEKKQTVLDSSADPSNGVHADIYVPPCSPPPASQRKSHHAFTSNEDEVTYSTVTIKPRNPSSPLQSKPKKNSVIYALLANRAEFD